MVIKYLYLQTIAEAKERILNIYFSSNSICIIAMIIRIKKIGLVVITGTDFYMGYISNLPNFRAEI
jgi:hypothetical protein